MELDGSYSRVSVVNLYISRKSLGCTPAVEAARESAIEFIVDG